MSWEVKLISLYLFICKHYESKLAKYCIRTSNYVDLKFSDEEVITLFLFGVIEGHRTVQAIHQYANKHLMDWFPYLPGYKAFDHRINQLHDVFAPLVILFVRNW